MQPGQRIVSATRTGPACARLTPSLIRGAGVDIDIVDERGTCWSVRSQGRWLSDAKGCGASQHQRQR